MKGAGKRKLQSEADGETEVKNLGQSADSNGDELVDEKECERDEEGNGDGEEDEDDEGEVGDDEEGKVADVVQEERPKLDDGYFEIEAICRKRVRKAGVAGDSQHMGTIENLQSCSDVIDAFEDRATTGSIIVPG